MSGVVLEQPLLSVTVTEYVPSTAERVVWFAYSVNSSPVSWLVQTI